MSTMKSVLHFPDGGELVITREVHMAFENAEPASGPGPVKVLAPGTPVATYNGRPVSDAKVERLLAEYRARMDAEMNGDA